MFILVILYIQEYLCGFYKIVYGYPGYPKISTFGYPVPEITKNTRPYHECRGSSPPPTASLDISYISEISEVHQATAETTESKYSILS